MTNEELDRFLAEKVMGFKIKPWTYQSIPHHAWSQIIEDAYFLKGEFVCLVKNWHPTIDNNQAMMCEDKIEEMELEQEYSDALENILKEKYSYPPSTFQIAHATPRQRGEAIYKAVEG